MSKLPPSPLHAGNANIPIYLDAGEDAEPRKQSHYTCPTCETSSRDQPIHCISNASPAPPSYRSIGSPPPSPGRLHIPALNIETSHDWSRPRAPQPALQFDPEGRPQVRFRRNAFSPLSPRPTTQDNIDWSRGSRMGLAIPGVQFQPDISPITPGTAEKASGEETEDSQKASNFAQRIEQKLWKYSASRNVVKRWLIEIISWTLSAACMAGIIVMLIVYKDKRIPKWPLGLTLNAYISVLSKVASAALLLPVSEALGQLKWSWYQGSDSKKMWDFEIFDNASRGPWGSLLLLVRTKGKSLAALGAAVTLFALALDPFFQQVVEYPERWRIQTEYGAIHKATGYDRFRTGIEFRYDTENMEIDAGLLGTLYRYFYGNGVPLVTFGQGERAEVPLACPSSNCTWAPYETLGVSSQCTDASESLEFKCLSDMPLDYVHKPLQNEEGVFIINGSSCGWWLKADDPLLMAGYNIDPDGPFKGEVLLMRNQPIYDLFSRDTIPGYSPRLNNSRNPLAHVLIVSGQDRDHVLRNATPIAHECIISWSVKTISSTYSEGGYVENVTKVVINDTIGPSPWFTEVVYDEQAELVAHNYLYLEDVIVQGEKDAYWVSNGSHSLTLALFDEIFPSTFSLINSTNETDARLRYKQYAYFNPYTRSYDHNPWIFGNVSEHLDKMTTAMTNMIRSSEIYTEEVLGSAFDKESFVDVRWSWLALPLALLALTFLFLTATVIRSSIEQDRVGVWKTSAIATLLYGLPDKMQKEIASDHQMGTPRARAKAMRVKWLPKRGWRLSGNSSLSVPSVKTSQNPSPISAFKARFSFSPVSPRPQNSVYSSSSTLKCSPSASPPKSPSTPPHMSPAPSPPPSPPKPPYMTPPIPHVSPPTPPPKPAECRRPSKPPYSTPPPGWI